MPLCGSALSVHWLSVVMDTCRLLNGLDSLLVWSFRDGVLRLGLERRLSMVLHSLALRDVVTLWVESVFILVRSEGLAVFAGVSSSVHCHLIVYLAEWTLVMFSSALCFVILRLGASRTNVLSFLIRSFGFLLEGSIPEWSVQRLVAVPWIEPSRVYSHIAVQVPADSDVYFSDGVVCVVGLSFCFPHYSSLCLPDGLHFFCHGPFWFCCGCSW